MAQWKTTVGGSGVSVHVKFRNGREITLDKAIGAPVNRRVSKIIDISTLSTTSPCCVCCGMESSDLVEHKYVLCAETHGKMTGRPKDTTTVLLCKQCIDGQVQQNESYLQKKADTRFRLLHPNRFRPWTNYWTVISLAEYERRDGMSQNVSTQTIAQPLESQVVLSLGHCTKKDTGGAYQKWDYTEWTCALKPVPASAGVTTHSQEINCPHCGASIVIAFEQRCFAIISAAEWTPSMHGNMKRKHKQGLITELGGAFVGALVAIGAGIGYLSHPVPFLLILSGIALISAVLISLSAIRLGSKPFVAPNAALLSLGEDKSLLEWHEDAFTIITRVFHLDEAGRSVGGHITMVPGGNDLNDFEFEDLLLQYNLPKDLAIDMTGIPRGGVAGNTGIKIEHAPAPYPLVGIPRVKTDKQ